MSVKVTDALLQQTADTLRMLAVDGVQQANSGHPGMPMGAADYAAVLWAKYLRYHAPDPAWPNRDRFVLSAGHGSMLLYGLLHLAGFGLTTDDLKGFRQWESRTPGHPEYGCAPGVETTTGPLGQGFSNAVGMAIAAKMMAARFNTEEFPLIDHRVYTIVSDGDLMEGVSSEAASLAGHLALDNLVCFYDDNHITIEGNTSLAFSESVAKRFEAYGWGVQTVDGHDREAVAGAVVEAQAAGSKPQLIICHSLIGRGSPNKVNTSGVHGEPLGAEEVAATKAAMGWPLEPTFYVPDEVSALFAARGKDLAAEYEAWQQMLAKYRQQQPEQAALWDALWAKAVPADIEEKLLAAAPTDPLATRDSGGKIMQAAAALVPSMVGGSADLAPSTKTLLKGMGDIAPGAFAGRNFHFGVREHGMGSVMNGLALYGSFIPYGATFLVFSDYMRPPMRLAALSGIQAIYVFTHDSIFVGEDGPTHQPIEHLAAMRCIPNMTVIRPAEAYETAAAWATALQHRGGPTALALTRQKLAPLDQTRYAPATGVKHGGYVLLDCEGEPEFILIATGSEVHIALEAQATLTAQGKAVRMVSMPSTDLFARQTQEYQDAVLPPACVKRVAVEAGCPTGWHRWVGPQGLIIGMDRFGASAPYQKLAEEFGFTAAGILAAMKKRFGV
jgi:transketolase